MQGARWCEVTRANAQSMDTAESDEELAVATFLLKGATCAYADRLVAVDFPALDEPILTPFPLLLLPLLVRLPIIVVTRRGQALSHVIRDGLAVVQLNPW